MRSDQKKHKIFTRRALILAGAKLSLFGVISARMYYLQFLKHSEYSSKAESNRIRVVPLVPIRGNILDKNNKPIASNRLFYRAVITKLYNDNYKQILSRLPNYINISEENIKNILQKIKISPINTRVTIKEVLTWEEMSKLKLFSFELPAIEIEIGQLRDYPYSNITSHITGYVSAMSKDDLKNHKFSHLQAHPDLKIGKNGLEYIYDENLRGKAGSKKLEVDAYGNIIQELSENPSLQGSDLKTYINIDIQNYLYNLLSPNGGAAVMIEIATNGVIAMVSSPSYDPNKFVYGISSKYWRELNTDMHAPLINKATSYPYPPGSTFKLVTALAALEAGIDPKAVVRCNGYVEISGHIFRCWNKIGHGHMNLENALTYSCNSYFYTIAKKIGIEGIANISKILGLGNLTGVESTNEKAGIIPDKNWKYNRFRQAWTVGDTVNTAIGQGYCGVTPIQLAVMTARIASGKNISPHLIQNFYPPQGKINISEDALTIIRNAMFRTVNLPGGTAYGSKLDAPNWQMSGKTGTAQVVSKQNSSIDLSAANIKFERRNHGIFVGYAPSYDPKYSISIVAEHAGSGSRGAAPIAKGIFDFMYSLGIY